MAEWGGRGQLGEGMAGYADLLTRLNVGEFVSRIRTSTTRSTLVPSGGLQKLASDSKLFAVQNKGHETHVEQSEECIRHITAIFGRSEVIIPSSIHLNEAGTI